MWKLEITLFSYLFIIFSHYLRIFGAPQRRRARPLPPWGLGPGFGPRNVKIIWKTYENNVISNSRMISTFFISFSYFSYVFGLGTQIWLPKVIFVSYSWSPLFHIIFILLWKPRFLACPYRQSLQHLEIVKYSGWFQARALLAWMVLHRQHSAVAAPLPRLALKVAFNLSSIHSKLT